ncbi:MAG: hypothetical protein AAFW83_08040 [Pseudomonadota bacterium]
MVTKRWIAVVAKPIKANGGKNDKGGVGAGSATPLGNQRKSPI